MVGRALKPASAGADTSTKVTAVEMRTVLSFPGLVCKKKSERGEPRRPACSRGHRHGTPLTPFPSDRRHAVHESDRCVVGSSAIYVGERDHLYPGALTDTSASTTAWFPREGERTNLSEDATVNTTTLSGGYSPEKDNVTAALF